MNRIDRNALAHAQLAGGAAKSSTGSSGTGGTFPAGGSSLPAGGTSTQTGKATSVITVNGQQVINQTVTF
ncbi:hypothetical protein P9239_02425 [Caballeronia sp. LZ062]|uniref:hypothetical protein n=1 Tax=unclassified Caballeronia TaxID=2646786 RepID=UPI00285C79E7|nr:MULTISPECIES: hypothetical protein [unclassified Caballeronia]MDR5857664.1 hypothetical protein [Caballeronia sp. LZ050]MDR5869214.1 hypothetical protein [Caballeronia sp. LZ062]